MGEEDESEFEDLDDDEDMEFVKQGPIVCFDYQPKYFFVEMNAIPKRFGVGNEYRHD